MTEIRDNLMLDIAKVQEAFDELGRKFGNTSENLKKEMEKCSDLDYQCQ